MKHLFFLLFFTVLALAAKAQSPVVSEGTSIEEKAAGYQFQLATKHYYTGLIIEGASFVMLAVGVHDPNNPNVGLVTLGSLGFIVGTIFMIESYSHIGKAGKILMGKTKYSFGPSSSGLGLACTF